MGWNSRAAAAAAACAAPCVQAGRAGRLRPGWRAPAWRPRRRRRWKRLATLPSDHRHVDHQAHGRDVVVIAFGNLVGLEHFTGHRQGHLDPCQHFVGRHHVLAVAGVQLLQRQLAVAAHAHQHHVGAQRDQERHAVANRRAVGHVAAQRARIAHRQAGEAVGKGLELRAVGHQRGKGLGQGHGCADGNVVRVALHAAQLLHLGHVQHLRELHVHLGHPQAHVGAAGHDLRARVGSARGQQLGFSGRAGPCSPPIRRGAGWLKFL
jgi:hypothetical protein